MSLRVVPAIVFLDFVGLFLPVGDLSFLVPAVLFGSFLSLKRLLKF
jgi:hypothetical protein